MPNTIIKQHLLLVCLWLAGAGPLAAATPGDTQAQRGEYLLYAGGCITCHTADEKGAIPLAGGREIASPFGTFYSPNITPDPETGIGNWTPEDFVRAFREGRSPSGKHYYPSFPYPSYTGMTEADMRAIGAYLMTLEPVKNANRKHDMPWYTMGRMGAGQWKRMHFAPGEFEPDPARDAEWNRGAYLVRHLGHCGECHTPRGRTGGLRRELEMAGAVDTVKDERIPNITPHPEDGIGRWSLDDLVFFLEVGMLPDGDFTGSSMSPVIDDNTARLTPADRRAIAVYLKSLPPLPTPE